MTTTLKPMAALRRSPIRSMLAVGSAVLGASLIAVTTAGSTYGLFADSQPMNAGIVTSGTHSLTVNTASISPSAWSSMFPGDRVQQSVTLTQAGGTRLTSSVVALAAAAPGTPATAVADYTVRVAKGACPGTALTGTNALTAPQSLGDWGPSASSAVCVEVTLASAAKNTSQGVAVPFTLTLSATQKPAA